MKHSFSTSMATTVLLVASVAAHAQGASSNPDSSASLKVTTPLTVGGKKVDIGAKPPPGNPGNNITVSPDRFSTPDTNTRRGDTAYGATVTIPMPEGKKK